MIRMPQRSVTRFFIPLIDVLILMFGIFILMPLVEATGDDGSGSRPLAAAERAELQKLRRQRRDEQDAAALQQELERLRKEKIEVLQQRLAVRVLEIDAMTGKLYYYDPHRTRDRRVEITEKNVAELVRSLQKTAGDRELYLLILYPRPATGDVKFPEKGQRQEYDRWLADVPHGYDVPMVAP